MAEQVKSIKVSEDVSSKFGNLEKKDDLMTTKLGDLEKACLKLTDEAQQLASEVTKLPKTLPSPLIAPTPSSATSTTDVTQLGDELKQKYEKLLTALNNLKVTEDILPPPSKMHSQKIQILQN